MEIARSFSKKIQLHAYEPIDVFCSAKMECEEKDAEKTSAMLDELVRAEVEKTLAIIRPPLKSDSINPRNSKEKTTEDTQISIEDFT